MIRESWNRESEICAKICPFDTVRNVEIRFRQERRERDGAVFLALRQIQGRDLDLGILFQRHLDCIVQIELHHLFLLRLSENLSEQDRAQQQACEFSETLLAPRRWRRWGR